MTYKLIGADTIPNLETLLNSGGVIDVEGPAALVISEIMWGSDASLDDPADSQWIELYNAGAEYKTVDNDAATDANEAVTLVFYGPADALPAIADVNDRVGTIDVNGAPWSVGGNRSKRSNRYRRSRPRYCCDCPDRTDYLHAARHCH